MRYKFDRIRQTNTFTKHVACHRRKCPSARSSKCSLIETFFKVAAPISAQKNRNYRPFICFHILVEQTLCVLPVPFVIFKRVTVHLLWERRVDPHLGLSWAEGSSSSFNKVLLFHSQTGPVCGSPTFCCHSVTVIKSVFPKVPRYPI